MGKTRRTTLPRTALSLLNWTAPPFLNPSPIPSHVGLPWSHPIPCPHHVPSGHTIHACTSQALAKPPFHPVVCIILYVEVDGTPAEVLAKRRNNTHIHIRIQLRLVVKARSTKGYLSIVK